MFFSRLASQTAYFYPTSCVNLAATLCYVVNIESNVCQIPYEGEPSSGIVSIAFMALQVFWVLLLWYNYSYHCY